MPTPALLDMIRSFFSKSQTSENCLICNGKYSHECIFCEYNKLKKENEILKEEIYRFQHPLTPLKVPKDFYINLENDIQDQPHSFKKDDFLVESSYFLTITFDPRKFGVDNDSDEERKYILYIIKKYIYYISNYYGCFEYHKNGAIHAHLIITLFSKYVYHDLRKKLKKEFTNDCYNKHAVDLQPIKNIEDVLQYINKPQSGKLYYTKSLINHLDQ